MFLWCYTLLYHHHAQCADTYGPFLLPSSTKTSYSVLESTIITNKCLFKKEHATVYKGYNVSIVPLPAQI